MRTTLDGTDWPLFESGTDGGAANAVLFNAGLGDGLPLVIPTAERVDRMLDGVMTPEASRGQVPPLFGELRPDAVAYQCVLAGCAPGAVPLVLTALEATLVDGFNLLGITTTTGTAAVALIVHAQTASLFGLNTSTNCLGPGCAVNATLGRALSLSLRNIAGAREGLGDMATMGQPAKYGLCVAEAQHELAAGPARRGEALSVLGISGTMEVLPRGDPVGLEVIAEPAALAMAAAATVASGGGRGGGPRAPGEQCLLLPPELADTLVRTGHDSSSVADYLLDAGAAALARLRPEWGGAGAIAVDAQAIHVIVTGGPGVKMTCLAPWAGGTQMVTRELSSPNAALGLS